MFLLQLLAMVPTVLLGSTGEENLPGQSAGDCSGDLRLQMPPEPEPLLLFSACMKSPRWPGVRALTLTQDRSPETWEVNVWSTPAHNTAAPVAVGDHSKTNF